jgi:hypothetical protein
VLLAFGRSSPQRPYEGARINAALIKQFASRCHVCVDGVDRQPWRITALVNRPLGAPFALFLASGQSVRCRRIGADLDTPHSRDVAQRERYEGLISLRALQAIKPRHLATKGCAQPSISQLGKAVLESTFETLTVHGRCCGRERQVDLERLLAGRFCRRCPFLCGLGVSDLSHKG